MVILDLHSLTYGIILFHYTNVISDFILTKIYCLHLNLEHVHPNKNICLSFVRLIYL